MGVMEGCVECTLVFYPVSPSASLSESSAQYSVHSFPECDGGLSSTRGRKLLTSYHRPMNSWPTRFDPPTQADWH